MIKKILFVILVFILNNAFNNCYGQINNYDLKYGLQTQILFQDSEFRNNPYKLSYLGRGFLRFEFGSAIEAEFGVSYGILRANDFTKNYWRTDIIPADFRLILSPFNNHSWSPYFYGGIGVLKWWVNNKPVSKSPNPVEDSGWHGFLPFGAGIEVALSDDLIFDINGGYNYTFIDDLNYFDNWTSAGNSFDGYFNVGIGITFVTGSGASDNDNDGLTKQQEKQLGTDPEVADTDGDGLIDGQEVNKYNTDPLITDSDGDGLSDYDEINSFNTNPNKTDTDGDGLKDGDEISKYKTSPIKKDSDNDGLTDIEELKIKTNPNKPDSDLDGLTDGDEINKYRTNPLNKDTDEDGLSDIDEIMKYKTNPLNVDSDKGSTNDKVEVDRGTNPLDPKDDIVLDVSAPIVLDGVTFASGKANLTPESERILIKAYNTLIAYPKMQVEIRGYTDSRGRASSNKRLSQKRAESVKNWLVSKGINPNRILAVGMGEANPIADNSTAKGRRLNRRIEFVKINQ